MNRLNLFIIIAYCGFMLVLIDAATYAVTKKPSPAVTKKPSPVAIQNTKQVTCVVELHQENELHEWHGVIK